MQQKTPCMTNLLWNALVALMSEQNRLNQVSLRLVVLLIIAAKPFTVIKVLPKVLRTENRPVHNAYQMRKTMKTLILTNVLKFLTSRKTLLILVQNQDKFRSNMKNSLRKRKVI